MPKSKNRKNHKQKVIARNRRLKEKEAQLRNKLIKALEAQEATEVGVGEEVSPPEIDAIQTGYLVEPSTHDQLVQQLGEMIEPKKDEE